MPVYYRWNNELLLKCTKQTIATLYQKIIDVIDEADLFVTGDMDFLIHELEKGEYGTGCDFNDVIKIKRVMNQFSKILSSAILRYEQAFPKLPDETKKSLWNFYNELVKHGNELPTHISQEKMNYRSDIPVCYYWKNKEILESTKKIIAPFFNRILDILDKEKIEPNANVDKTINVLENDLYDLTPTQFQAGTPLSLYLHNQRDVHEFSEILKKAIQLYEHDDPTLSAETKELLWDFYHKLLEIRKELPE